MKRNLIQFPQPSPLDEFILIPEGLYELKLVTHYTAIQFQSPRLVMEFSVCECGDYFGSRLFRYYHLERLDGKAGKHGRFVAKARGDLMIEYCTLFPRKVRRDRLSLAPLYNSVIIGKVATVTKNNQGKALPEPLQYSKISELVRLAS